MITEGAVSVLIGSKVFAVISTISSPAQRDVVNIPTTPIANATPNEESRNAVNAFTFLYTLALSSVQLAGHCLPIFTKTLLFKDCIPEDNPLLIPDIIISFIELFF
ncbi:hypothetical protein CLAVI_000947 [Candidatus Clavichlamydia salmonicola]|nr:hypothetical protein [Candidatus Clavichlamydia salmonicola]